MKAKFTILAVAALTLGACSSTYYASSGYDDLYYRPGKVDGSYRVVAQNNDGKTEDVSNYEKYRDAMEKEEVYDTTANPNAEKNYQDQKDQKAQAYSTESEEYVDKDGNTYVTENNNYYTSALRRYDGYYGYGGYYDPWYYDPFYYSSGWGIGFGIGCAWGYPFFGAYGSYGFYGSPYYSSYAYGYWDGYYSGGGGYYVPNQGISERTRYNNTYGRSSTGRRTYAGSGFSSSRAAGTSRSAFSGTSSDNSRSKYTRSYSADAYRPSYSRTSQTTATTEPGTSSTSSSTRTYTPSYSKPRTYSRPTYNDSQGSTYTRAASSSSSRAASSSTNTRSSSPTYSTPTYSTPTRSSTPSYSTPSSGSGRSSSGSSGGSGGRSSSSGGRR